MTKEKSEALEKLKIFDTFFEKITNNLMFTIPPIMSHKDISSHSFQLQSYERLFMDHLILQVKNNVSAVRVGKFEFKYIDGISCSSDFVSFICYFQLI